MEFKLYIYGVCEKQAIDYIIYNKTRYLQPLVNDYLDSCTIYTNVAIPHIDYFTPDDRDILEVELLYTGDLMGETEEILRNIQLTLQNLPYSSFPIYLTEGADIKNVQVETFDGKRWIGGTMHERITN